MQVRARDEDAGEFGEVRFELSEEDDGKPFEIDTGPGGMGTITTTRPLDFEQLESYTLTVIVEDLADPPRSSLTTFNVTVVNINDNSPIFVGDGGEQVDTVTRRVFEETSFPFTVLSLQVCNDQLR